MGTDRATRLVDDAPLVMSFSFSLDPMLEIVERHVRLTPAARQAIKTEWSKATPHVNVVPEAAPEPVDEILTTEQAARDAGVSRPFMVKLIDGGDVELHQMVGNQRRVKRSAVQRWRANERVRQVQALKQLGEDLDTEIFSE